MVPAGVVGRIRDMAKLFAYLSYRDAGAAIAWLETGATQVAATR